MVDGINTTNPRLPGTGENREAVSKTVEVSNSRNETQSSDKTNQLSSEVKENVSSAITKSAEKRLDALTAGKTIDFLQAAEKFINASLPSKPPGTRLRINLDDGSGRFVYQGVDINTGDVISQFPSEEILKFVAFNREREGIEGIVVDEEV